MAAPSLSPTLSSFRPFSIAIPAFGLAWVWLWLAMSDFDYQGQPGPQSLRTNYNIIIAFPLALVAFLGLALGVALLIRKTNYLVGLFLLAMQVSAIWPTYLHAMSLPDRLARIVGSELAEQATVERYHTQSIRGRQLTHGVLTGPPGYFERLEKELPLKRLTPGECSLVYVNRLPRVFPDDCPVGDAESMTYEFFQGLRIYAVPPISEHVDPTYFFFQDDGRILFMKYPTGLL